LRMQEEDLGTLSQQGCPQVVDGQIWGLDPTLTDALDSQSHLSCRLWESQSDVEVGHQMEGSQVVIGMEKVGQGGLLCEKREGRDHCLLGKEEKSQQTGMGEVEEDPQGVFEPKVLLEGGLKSGPLVVAAPRTAENRRERRMRGEGGLLGLCVHCQEVVMERPF